MATVTLDHKRLELALCEYMKNEPILRDFITKDGNGSVISFDEKGFVMAVLDHLKNTPKLEHFFNIELRNPTIDS